MFPKSDCMIWNYLPNCFFDEKLAEQAIAGILKKDLFDYSSKFDFDRETPITSSFKPYADILENQHKKRLLGRYPCRIVERSVATWRCGSRGAFDELVGEGDATKGVVLLVIEE